jgi:hypothetical protein
VGRRVILLVGLAFGSFLLRHADREKRDPGRRWSTT